MSDLVLVKLSEQQIRWIKTPRAFGKKITHAVLCGAHGQLLGSEAQCREKFELWRVVFKRLFRRAYETDNYPTVKFTSTPNLVAVLIAEDDRRQKTPMPAQDSLSN